MTTETSAPTSSTATPYRLPSIAEVSGLWRGITGKKLQHLYILEGLRGYCRTKDRRFALAVALLRSTRYRFRTEKQRALFVVELCDDFADMDFWELYFEGATPPSEAAMTFLKKRPNATFRDLAERGEL